MPSYDLYGTRLADIDQVKEQLENLLGCEFEGHESEYIGVYYLCEFSQSENVSIKLNQEPGREELLEDEWPDQKVLIYVNETSRPETFRNLLNKDEGTFYLLRHEDI